MLAFSVVRYTEKEQQNESNVKTKTKKIKVTALTLNFMSKADMLPRFLG